MVFVGPASVLFAWRVSDDVPATLSNRESSRLIYRLIQMEILSSQNASSDREQRTIRDVAQRISTVS